MDISFKDISPVEIDVSGRLSWSDVKEIYENELLETTKRAKIPGFRTGMAPRELIERRYGDEIRSRAIKSKIIEILNEETRKKERWVGLSSIRELVWNESGEVISFSVRVEVVPRVRLDLGVEVGEKPKIEVSDEEVKNEVEKMRERSAVLVQSDKDELTGSEDEVGVFDITIKDIKTQRLLKREENELVDISNSKEWFKEAVVGMRKGQRKEMVLDGDKKATISLKDIKKKSVPSDEDLVKALGYNAESEMLDDIRKKIYETKKRWATESLYFSAIGKLIEKNKIKIPPGLVERYLVNIVSSNSAINRNNAQELATMQAAEYIVLANMIEDFKIQVSEKELEDYITENFGEERKKEVLKDMRDEIERNLRMKKAKAKLLEVLKITDT